MRRVQLSPDDFPNRVVLFRSESGTVFTAERAEMFYLIQDESSMGAFLSEEDACDLIAVIEFETLEERDHYIRERRWEPSARE